MANLKSYVWVTLNEVKEALDITTGDHDAKLNGYINRATDLIENYCQRNFLQATYTNEEYQGNGTYYMQLRSYPIQSITDISYRTSIDFTNPNWTSIASRLYEVAIEGKTNAGRVYSVWGWPVGGAVNNYRFTYSGGYAMADIPEDLKEALMEIVSHLFNARKRDPMLMGEQLGNYNYRLSPKEIGKSLLQHLGVDIILDQYRSIPV